MTAIQLQTKCIDALLSIHPEFEVNRKPETVELFHHVNGAIEKLYSEIIAAGKQHPLYTDIAKNTKRYSNVQLSPLIGTFQRLYASNNTPMNDALSLELMYCRDLYNPNKRLECEIVSVEEATRRMVDSNNPSLIMRRPIAWLAGTVIHMLSDIFFTPGICDIYYIARPTLVSISSASTALPQSDDFYETVIDMTVASIVSTKSNNQQA